MKDIHVRTMEIEVEQNLALNAPIFVYGAGCYGQAFAWLARKKRWNLSGFLISDGENSATYIYGYPVVKVSEAGDLNESTIILAINENLRSQIRLSLPEGRYRKIEFPNLYFEKIVGYKMFYDTLKLVKRKLRIWHNAPAIGHMRVLFFTHGSELLGANRSLFWNLMYWQKLGIEAMVVSPSVGELNRVLVKHGIPSIAIPYAWWVNTNHNVQNYDNTCVEHDLYKVLQRCHFNLVYSNSSVIDIGAHIAERLKLPHIWHIREFVEEDFGWHFFLGRREAMEYILSRSNKTICISKAILHKCEEIVQRKNVFCLIPNGVCLDIEVESKKSEFYNDVLRIAMCGSVQDGKNQKELLVALSLLPKDVLQHYEIDFYGSQNEEYKKTLDEYIKYHNLQDRVCFYGYVDDVIERLRTCQIGVIASRMEAFGRVTVEYMLAGLLTIASNTGANPEILRNGNDGLLYEYGNPESLAKCLIWCEKNRSKMHGMANRAQFEARERFSPQKTADSIYDIMKKALNE